MGKIKKMRRSQGTEQGLTQQYLEDTSVKQKNRPKVRLKKTEDDEEVCLIVKTFLFFFKLIFTLTEY